MSTAPGLIFIASLISLYSGPGFAQFCQPLNATLFGQCINKAGYNYTFITNNSDFPAVEELLSFIVQTEISNLASCSAHSALLLCSMYVPRCVEGGNGPSLPCRSICYDVVRGCEDLNETLFYDDLEWIKGMCQLLPNGSSETETCFEPESFRPRYATGENQNMFPCS